MYCVPFTSQRTPRVTLRAAMWGERTGAHAEFIVTGGRVCAAIFAYWLQGDRMGPIALGGAALIVAGMLATELGPYILNRRTARRMEKVGENIHGG